MFNENTFIGIAVIGFSMGLSVGSIFKEPIIYLIAVLITLPIGCYYFVKGMK